MSTRSFIIHNTADGYIGIYCHWDGYLDHNGQILLEHYVSSQSVGELINAGDLSVLGTTLDDCELYRDRGDSWDTIKPSKHNRLIDLVAIAARSGCEFIYYFDGTQWQYAARGAQYFGLSDGSSFTEFRSLSDAIEYDSKTIALAKHLGIDLESVDESSPDMFAANGREFLVLSDAEADQAFDAALDNFLDECVLPDIPEHLQSYFNTSDWKRDAAFDGRGHSLAGYDGHEHEEDDFYIYRIN